MSIMVRVGAKIDYDNEQFPFEEMHQRRAQKNHYQTLERINERGGLSWSEALAILQGRDYRTVADAEKMVRAIFAQTEHDPKQDQS